MHILRSIDVMRPHNPLSDAPVDDSTLNTALSLIAKIKVQSEKAVIRTWFISTLQSMNQTSMSNKILRIHKISRCAVYIWKKLLVKIFTRFAPNIYITRTRYAALIKENVTTQAKKNALLRSYSFSS